MLSETRVGVNGWRKILKVIRLSPVDIIIAFNSQTQTPGLKRPGVKKIKPSWTAGALACARESLCTTNREILLKRQRILSCDNALFWLRLRRAVAQALLAVRRCSCGTAALGCELWALMILDRRRPRLRPKISLWHGHSCLWPITPVAQPPGSPANALFAFAGVERPSAVAFAQASAPQARNYWAHPVASGRGPRHARFSRVGVGMRSRKGWVSWKRK